MKKSIKYAGIAAATLLTVAPVAAPVVSNVTTVQAADSDKNADQSEIDKGITDFGNQFGDQDASDVTFAAKNLIGLGKDNAVDLATFQTNAGALLNTDNTAKLTKLKAQGAKVYVTATDFKGTTYDGTIGKDSSDLNSVMALDSYLPIKVTVYVQYNALDGTGYTPFKQAATFNLNKSDEDELTSVNAKFTTPLTVAKNSKVAATQLVNGSNVSLTDQNGDSIATDSITLGKGYFYTYSEAMKATDPDTGDVKEADISLKDDETTLDEFKTAGTYYQRVTYTAKSGSSLATLLGKFTTDPNGYSVYVNGKKASAGYDFVNTDDTISFVRAINVSDSEAEWTTEKTSGVVTTKNDADYYTLKNNDNNSIKNRALAKNTAWKTNAVRTDQNGNKQYRVATGEWIDADSVTFSDKATDNNNGTGLTDIVKTKGVVVINKGANYVYPLFDANGDTIKGRAVSGDNTAWQVAATAKDADGNTYYKVATNEWVMGGEGVTFNAAN
ncbi:hypothetical protein [Companilactobacillus insicii]|uniref:hypothetical protein n=1 Tax=Companilactobacillus insicii TaxID=1732567 RepID=UPI000F76F373|nr:hypothetical protein [Companilactobacillus insicii]